MSGKLVNDPRIYVYIYMRKKDSAKNEIDIFPYWDGVIRIFSVKPNVPMNTERESYWFLIVDID